MLMQRCIKTQTEDENLALKLKKQLIFLLKMVGWWKVMS